MDNISTEIEARRLTAPRPSKPGVKAWAGSLIALGLVAGGVIAGPRLLAPSADQAAVVTPPVVAVSVPLQRNVDTRLQFLGQFSAVDQVELRAQVGGTLTQIGFKDGDIVHKGDLLFEIDPTPYQIKLSEATAQLESTRARLDLANREAVRASTLARTGAGSVQAADQRGAEQRAAQAAVNEAEARVRDALFDLNHTVSRHPSQAASARILFRSATLSRAAEPVPARLPCWPRSSPSTPST
jgi:multidrug efflux pump subunit AcrA (membrane-fusion protein)